jgi:hypothetical protein
VKENMKKYKYVPLFLLCSIFLSIPLTGIAKAQTTPGYVGVSEGDVYTWQIKMSEEGLNSFEADLEALKNEYNAKLGT